MRGARLYVLILIYGVFLVAAVALYFGKLTLPPEWNPFTIVRLDGAVGPFTRMKLRRLHEEPEICLAALSVSELAFSPHPGIPIEEGCGIENGVEVVGADITYSDDFAATCGLAAGLYMFQREILQPAAERHFGQRVVGIDHSGTYDCRNVGFRTAGPRSQHARANAMDMVGFRFGDGTRVRVSRQNWESDGPEGGFLREVHRGACRLFGSVLGPDYDAMHYTHFHFDMRPDGVCR
ncbi:MAG: extensin family protein [Alphaproteobacteria bacterium]|nr:extensin family protein [Alphaproteobacteria bacterium]